MKRTLLICSLSLFALSACNMNSVKGDGHVITRNFDQKGFRDIEASSSLEVHLSQGPEYKIKVEGEENIIQQLDIHVNGDKLSVGMKNNVMINTHHPLKVFITAPEFRQIEGSGACQFFSTGKLTSNSEFKIDLEGACETKLEVDAPKIDVDASGASEIKMKGHARDFSIDASGASDIDCFDLLTENTTLDISGGGSANVYASQSLTVSVSGAGDVHYKGKPSKINKDISGAGSITEAN